MTLSRSCMWRDRGRPDWSLQVFLGHGLGGVSCGDGSASSSRGTRVLLTPEGATKTFGSQTVVG